MCGEHTRTHVRNRACSWLIANRVDYQLEVTYQVLILFGQKVTSGKSDIIDKPHISGLFLRLFPLDFKFMNNLQQNIE